MQLPILSPAFVPCHVGPASTSPEQATGGSPALMCLAEGADRSPSAVASKHRQLAGACSDLQPWPHEAPRRPLQPFLWRASRRSRRAALPADEPWEPADAPPVRRCGDPCPCRTCTSPLDSTAPTSLPEQDPDFPLPPPLHLSRSSRFPVSSLPLTISLSLLLVSTGAQAWCPNSRLPELRPMPPAPGTGSPRPDLCLLCVCSPWPPASVSPIVPKAVGV